MADVDKTTLSGGLGEMDSAVEAEEGQRESSAGRRILAIVLIILILLLAVVGYFLFRIMVPEGTPTGEDTGEMSWIRSIYGFGEALDQLTIPSGIALEANTGNIWMADPSDFRLVEYAPDGTYLDMIAPGMETTSTTGGGARLRLPADIAMDSDGLLYVAEPTYDVVRVFQTDGTELGEIGVPSPLSLAVNDEYLVVGAESGVAVLDKLGNPISLIGSQGKGADQFDKVNGVAIDESNVIYAADTFNNRISAWTPDGENVWTVETGFPGNEQMTGEITYETSATAQMQLPMGMTLDANGQLIVSDMHDFSLAVFDKSDGTFIAKYGTLGFDDGKFFYPSDVDYDKTHDWFVVSDTGAKRAQIMRLPNSGGSLLTRARSGLSGPLKACCFPLLFLLIVIFTAVIVDRIKKRRRAAEGEYVLGPEEHDSIEDASEE